MFQRYSVVALLLTSTITFAQHPTGGTDHWAAFLVNAYGDDARRVLITSAGPAAGEVSMPLLGFSEVFDVQPGEVTVVQLPNGVQNPAWGAGEEGIHITSDARVSVQLESVRSFTSDVSQLLPADRTGTSYVVNCYAGMPGVAGLYGSEFVVVAQADSTQVEIIPSAAMSDGHPAGSAFTVWLNAGGTWMGRSAADGGDLTGTVVRGGPENAPEKNFSVYAGAMCAATPSNCAACDHYFEQQLPVAEWSLAYLAPAVDGITSYSVRVLAQEDGTWVGIDGQAPVQLDAGQWQELNGLASGVCITANKPIAVNRYMEGYQCANVGDPSQIGLMPMSSPITQATFSAPDQDQVEQHSITITAAMSDFGDVALDAVPLVQIPTAYAACSDRGYVTVPIGPGAHELSCPSGCQAQVQGLGTGQSYAFSLMQGAIAEQIAATGLVEAGEGSPSLIFDHVNRLLSWPGNVNPFQVDLRDLAGRLVYTARVSGSAGIRLPVLPAGVYVAMAQGQAGSVSGKFMVP